MRVSTSYFAQRGLASMLEQQKRLSDIQLQIATNRRILRPSDDPTGAAHILRLEQAVSSTAQYQRNADAALNRLTLEEATLDNVQESLLRIREIAIQGSNSTLGYSDRYALAQEVRERMSELVSYGNTRDANQEYLFAGYQATTQPFSQAADGSFIYSGDQGQRAIQISSGRQIADSDSGSDVFVNIKNGNGTFQINETATNTVVPGSFTSAVSDGVPQINGFNTQSISTLDWSAAGNDNGTFTIDGHAIDMGATSFANEAALVAEIQADLDAAAVGEYLVSSTGTVAGSDFDVTITRTNTHATPTGAVVLAGVSADAITAGITNNAGMAGSAQVNGFNTQTTVNTLDWSAAGNDNGTFTIDGHAIDMGATSFANEAALVAEIQADLNVAAVGEYLVSSTGTVLGTDFELTITRTNTHATPTGAVVIAGASADAVTAGLANTAGTAGSAQVNGVNTQPINTLNWAAAGNDSGTFTIDGHAIDMGGFNFANETALVTVIQADLDASAVGEYLVTSTGTVAGSDFEVSITRTNAHASPTGAVVIAGASVDAITAGIANNEGTPGAAAVPSSDTAFTMSIDGTQFYTEAALPGATVTAAELDTALTTFVAASAGAYTIDSGSIATGDLVLSKTDGTLVTMTIDSNFSTTAGSFSGNLVSGGNTGTGIFQVGQVIDPTAYVAETYNISFVTNANGKLAYNVVGSVSGQLIPPTPQDPVANAPDYKSGSVMEFNGIQTGIAGAPDVGDSYTVSPSSTQDMFSSVKKLVDALETKITVPSDQSAIFNAINQTISEIDLAFDNVIRIRTNVGARLNTIEDQSSVNESFKIEMTATLSEVRDLDIAEAAVEMQSRLVSLEAAQTTYTRIQGLSLFEFL